MKGAPPSSYSRLPVRHLLQRLVHAPAALAMIWPALLILGCYIAWNRWGAEEIAKQFYGVDVARIHITQRPPHITDDIVAAVYRDTRLDQISLVAPDATARIASAFASHPWVSKVVSVRKLPGGQVDVHLQYRVPVAMVYVISRHPSSNGRPSFFAVDGEGVLLPTAALSREDTLGFLHIEIPDVYPNGGVGSRFGDARIDGAARLAAALAPYREQLGARSIQLHTSSRITPVPQYQVLTDSGDALLWGSAPGQEIEGEPGAIDKLAQWIAKDTVPSVADAQRP